MFEECFSMIELNVLTESNDGVVAEIPTEPDFDDLQSMLVSALDEALCAAEEGLLSIH